MKKAILVISFGTSYNQTCKKTIEAIELDIKTAFSDFEIRRAFTSQFIINKLKKRDGIEIDSVKTAMQKLLDEGFDTVICQPTHVMNGHEFDKLSAVITQFTDKFNTLRLGRPLLSYALDYKQLICAFKKSLPQLDNNEALVLVGHGSSHFADSAYAALNHHLSLEGINNMFVGTVEGFPTLDDVLKQVDDLKAKKVYLAPLMVVAGDHACNNISVDWANAFKNKGYTVELILKGIGEYSAIRQIYVDHARDALC